MRRRLTTLGLGLILGAFVSHWAIIVVGVGRDNPLRQAMTSVLEVYYQKLFYQRWRLFAPEPSTASKKFYYRCHNDDAWSPWQDPIAPLLEKHYRYRVTHHGKEVRIPIRLAISVGRDLQTLEDAAQCETETCEREVSHRLRNKPSFQNALRYSWDRCGEIYPDQSLQAVQFQIAQVMIPSPESKAAGERPDIRRRIMPPQRVTRN